jgi:hypothetical protein
MFVLVERERETQRERETSRLQEDTRLVKLVPVNPSCLENSSIYVCFSREGERDRERERAVFSAAKSAPYLLELILISWSVLFPSSRFWFCSP